ncbi:MAG TPA: VOC family protein [Gemmatimonadaceae bacterium]|nr:VOC family protein [Gemmatimonadaceae bacterium]
MRATLDAVHPVLGSTDLHRSLRFFESLGFTVTFQDAPTEPRYAAVVRDGVELHLQWARPEDLPTGDRPVFRIAVTGVDDLHAELAAAGVFTPENNGRSPWASPKDTPWGTREFHLRDPDGNGLQFYAEIA